ncbi:VOC family protein [Mucilaginibacter sp.]|uniref:VOC family protein n=1 Tax=Mucilaginibacter sp. TaxID=1882438 RepID=UPI00262CF59B|nr:VOC family protein [Mucilaginibacter sp.]MDB4922063.1 hypothetical protein [Mucilaginibacter sp.]
MKIIFIVTLFAASLAIAQNKPIAMENKNSEQQQNIVAVRYIVHDVDSAISFYTRLLDFKVNQHPAPGFADIYRGNLHLLLNKPGAGGAGQTMPDGTVPAPGGWNRIQIQVEDLTATVDKLKALGAQFRNDLVNGIGGRQILLKDPSGNLIELFQPKS